MLPEDQAREDEKDQDRIDRAFAALDDARDRDRLTSRSLESRSSQWDAYQDAYGTDSGHGQKSKHIVGYSSNWLACSPRGEARRVDTDLRHGLIQENTFGVRALSGQLALQSITGTIRPAPTALRKVRSSQSFGIVHSTKDLSRRLRSQMLLICWAQISRRLVINGNSGCNVGATPSFPLLRARSLTNLRMASLGGLNKYQFFLAGKSLQSESDQCVEERHQHDVLEPGIDPR